MSWAYRWEAKSTGSICPCRSRTGTRRASNRRGAVSYVSIETIRPFLSLVCDETVSWSLLSLLPVTVAGADPNEEAVLFLRERRPSLTVQFVQDLVHPALLGGL